MTRHARAVLGLLALPAQGLLGQQSLADIPTGTFTYRLEIRWDDGRVDHVSGTLFIERDAGELRGRMVWDSEWVASEDYRTITLADLEMVDDGWLQFKAARRYQQRPRFGSRELDDVFFGKIKFRDDGSYAGEWWDLKSPGDLFGRRTEP